MLLRLLHDQDLAPLESGGICAPWIVNSNHVAPASPQCVTNTQKNHYLPCLMEPEVWGTSWFYSWSINMKCKLIWLSSFPKSMFSSRLCWAPSGQQSWWPSWWERCHSTQTSPVPGCVWAGYLSENKWLMWNKTTCESFFFFFFTRLVPAWGRQSTTGSCCSSLFPLLWLFDYIKIKNGAFALMLITLFRWFAKNIPIPDCKVFPQALLPNLHELLIPGGTGSCLLPARLFWASPGVWWQSRALC